MNQCYKLITKKQISRIIENLDVIDNSYYPEYDVFANINIPEIVEVQELTLSPDEEVLSKKLLNLQTEMNQRKQKAEKELMSKFTLFGYNLEEFDATFKAFYLLIVIAVFMFAVLILLNMTKKEKAKNKKN